MGLRKVFRAPHLLLLLAACLCAAMVFAPIAYSMNFRNNINVEVYGSWMQMENLLEGTTNKVQTIYFYEDFFVFVYAFLSAFAAGFLLFILFLSRDNVQRTRRLVYANALLFLHIAWGLAIYFHASDSFGKIDPQYIESGFQREFMLHFFILMFTWMAKVRYRKAGQLDLMVGS